MIAWRRVEFVLILWCWWKLGRCILQLWLERKCPGRWQRKRHLDMGGFCSWVSVGLPGSRHGVNAEELCSGIILFVWISMPTAFAQVNFRIIKTGLGLGIWNFVNFDWTSSSLDGGTLGERWGREGWWAVKWALIPIICKLGKWHIGLDVQGDEVSNGVALLSFSARNCGLPLKWKHSADELAGWISWNFYPCHI